MFDIFIIYFVPATKTTTFKVKCDLHDSALDYFVVKSVMKD